MKKILVFMFLASALTACENELTDVNEQFETRLDAEDEKKEDVNFRIWKDRTQQGKEF